eukprot:gnl/MRDRNA2_/MRDRNA2_99365_c0_seq1.p1 gnl/MRDRNA2_/MRDRNA2_99365_c0~~gnl/MRDRNA2_/MRDRNA2_99365_c0_seq1.p1  ORF type:complete len:389 (+),score=58.71 gnl/MRDRNA2_/MRDRNA2_99365_c0_seq1:86-1252(+)
MGRKKKEEKQETTGEPGIIIPCRRCTTPLELVSTESAYECDFCSNTISQGTSFHCCPQCDFSLCETCHQRKQEETKLEAERQAKHAKYIVPAGQIHPEVWALCEHFEVQDHLVSALNEEMSCYHDEWEAIMEQIYRDMSKARGNRSGFLCGILKQLRYGKYLGAYPPEPEIAKVIREYRLDKDARETLTHFLQKRKRDQYDWEKELWETEQRLATANNPSKMTHTMIMLIAQEKPLPEIRQRKKDAVKEYDRRHSRRSRSRSRSRDRRHERYRSRSRDRRDRGHDDRGRDKDDNEMKEIELFIKGVWATRSTAKNPPPQVSANTTLQGSWSTSPNLAGARKKDSGISVPETVPVPTNVFQVNKSTAAVPKFGAWQLGPSTLNPMLKPS